MPDPFNLSRFVDAQSPVYDTVLGQHITAEDVFGWPGYLKVLRFDDAVRPRLSITAGAG